MGVRSRDKINNYTRYVLKVESPDKGVGYVHLLQNFHTKKHSIDVMSDLEDTFQYSGFDTVEEKDAQRAWALAKKQFPKAKISWLCVSVKYKVTAVEK